MMIYVAAGLVVAALVAMASGRVDPLLALLVALILAGILGIAPAGQLAAGLSNAGVITVAAMLVIAKGIVQTGVISRATWALLASTSTARQVFRRLSFPIGVASALINTTPLVALLIPAARQLEQAKRIAAREVLLPLAHVTTLAGSVTLIGTSSNLVIAGIAGERGVDMGMFSFAAVALPVAVVGAVVSYLTGPSALRGTVVTAARSRDWRVEIPVAPARPEPPCDGVGDLQNPGARARRIQWWGTMVGPDEQIEGGDRLVFEVVVWPGSTIDALAIVAGISMVLGGVTRITGAIRGRVDERVIAALTGAASVIFGLLALSWPDKTVLILALLVGPSTVIFGLGQLLAAWRQHLGRHAVVRRGRQPRWLRASGAVAAVICALALVAVSAAIHGSAASPDAFYKPPSTVADRPGVLLRSEVFTPGIP